MSRGSCIGASAGGTVTELIALGSMDKYLTANPTLSFWTFRYNHHTNFALESIQQPFNSPTNFGSDVQLTINRNGDLIYFMYVTMKLPGIKAVTPTSGVCGIGTNTFPCCDPCDPCGDGEAPDDCPCCPSGSSQQLDDLFDFSTFDDLDTCTGLSRPWAHWTNAIGQFLIKRACLVIGGSVVSTLYNDYLYMWEELTGKPGKRLREMIGKRFTRAQLVADSRQTRTLYVPLPFFFAKVPGNALSLASLQFHGVQIHICFEDLRNCVQVSDCDALVVKCDGCQPLSSNDTLNAMLDTTYVYLDIEERDRFATGSFDVLIDQVQSYTQTNARNTNMQLTLNFNHPVIELIWAIRRQCQKLCNNHFVFSGVYGKDPIKTVSLCLNNLPRFNLREGQYFRLVQPYQFHTNIPEAFIYVYSFGLYPELPQPSGSANFSRIDNVLLELDLQDELQDETVTAIVFARNWNLFRYRAGLGGVSFAN